MGPDQAASMVVVQLAPDAGTDAVTSLGATVLGDIPGTGFVRVRPSGDAESLVAGLLEQPGVVAASVDYPRRKSAAPNDGFYGLQQDYLGLVRMPAAWDRITDASSQVVAVIDTGVDGSHPDLAGRLVPGYN